MPVAYVCCAAEPEGAEFDPAAAAAVISVMEAKSVNARVFEILATLKIPRWSK